MARFCANCGASMDEGDRVCGQCGTPVGDIAGVAGENKPKVAGANNKSIKIIVGVVAVVVLLVIAANLVKGFTGYKGTLNKMVKALKNYDVETIESLASSIYDATEGSWYGDDLYDYYDDIVSDALDVFEDNVGSIKKITYEVTDETEFSDRRLEALEEDLVEYYNMDTSDIKKIVEIELKLIVKGKSKSSAYNVDGLYMIKESGGWKIYYGNLDL